MPNAETHLAAACDLLALPQIQSALPWLLADVARAAFLLGSVSPDARAVSGQSRETTHFFSIPPENDQPASEVMLSRWPALAGVHDQARAAFVAGYMTHLIMDQTWVEMVVMPGLFIDGVDWGFKHPNWRLYCILMTYLEYQAAPRLPDGAARLIAGAQPEGWLPFIADQFLAHWGAHVARIVEQGGPRLVSSGLVKTCRMTPDEMEAIILSEEAMTRQAYPVVTRDQLAAFEAETARRCLDTVADYLTRL